MAENIAVLSNGCNYATGSGSNNGWMRKFKKLAEDSEGDSKSEESVSRHTDLLAGIERGIDIETLKHMTLGDAVDLFIDYNERQEDSEKSEAEHESKGNRRKATQADWDSFFG